MTFKSAERKLNNLSEKQLDKLCVLLANLHKKISKRDKKTAIALELSAMALCLYTEKKQQNNSIKEK